MTANLILLLRLIKSGASFDPLHKRGLESSQVFDLVSEAIEQGLLTATKRSIELTPQGNTTLAANPEGRAFTDGGWIEPDRKSRIEKSRIDTPYFPRKI